MMFSRHDCPPADGCAMILENIGASTLRRHHEQRCQSLAEWQRKRKVLQCLSPSPACPMMFKNGSVKGSETHRERQ